MATLHSERFQEQTPRQVYAERLEEEKSLCAARTMYRVLRRCRETGERRNQLPARFHTDPRL